jgi:hypothetical protein
VKAAEHIHTWHTLNKEGDERVNRRFVSVAHRCRERKDSSEESVRHVHEQGSQRGDFATVNAKCGDEEYPSHRASCQPQQRNDPYDVVRERFRSEIVEIDGANECRPKDDQECSDAGIHGASPATGVFYA